MASADLILKVLALAFVLVQRREAGRVASAALPLNRAALIRMLPGIPI
jgi:hypothetical protein